MNGGGESYRRQIFQTDLIKNQVVPQSNKE
jgi:hypothetical protein